MDYVVDLHILYIVMYNIPASVSAEISNVKILPALQEVVC